VRAARAGWDVAINYTRDATAAKAVAAEVRALGRRAMVVQAYWPGASAQQMAERDAREAARLQKEADQAQARADALRINFERGMDSARAAADIKRVETNKLIEVALSSEQPLIAPGLLLVDPARLTVQPFRMALATDTVRTPSVTTRTGILYLKNLAGFEGQTQGHQQAFFNYLFAEQIGKGKAIAAEAFRGPMSAQQGINLLNSRVWVAEPSEVLTLFLRPMNSATPKKLPPTTARSDWVKPTANTSVCGELVESSGLVPMRRPQSLVPAAL
jgi:hypothetical protein